MDDKALIYRDSQQDGQMIDSLHVVSCIERIFENGGNSTKSIFDKERKRSIEKIL